MREDCGGYARRRRRRRKARVWSAPFGSDNKIFVADRGGVEQGFCRGPQQGIESRPDDWDQVLGGKGGLAAWDNPCLIAFFSASTSSHSSSRWRRIQQGRWPQYSMSQTVLTTQPSSMYNFPLLLLKTKSHLQFDSVGRCFEMWSLPSTSPSTSQCICDHLPDIMRLRTCNIFKCYRKSIHMFKFRL